MATTELFSEWRRQLEALDDNQATYERQIETFGKFVPLVETFNAVIPALHPVLRPSLDRVKSAAKSLSAVLKKIDQQQPLDADDHAAVRAFLVEHQRFGHLQDVMQREIATVKKQLGDRTDSEK